MDRTRRRGRDWRDVVDRRNVQLGSGEQRGIEVGRDIVTCDHRG